MPAPRKSSRATVASRVGIYCRISDAREDDSTGVERQERACRKLAQERGLEVVGVYVDNAFSAFSGRRRPAFDRLMNDLGAGHLDAVVVWSADRLYRRLADLEVVADRLGQAPVFTVKSGDVDLSTADTRFIAELFGSLAMRESRKVGERVKAAAVGRAERGGFSGGKRRFGYTARAPLALVPAEADAIRDGYAQILNGESIKSIARNWTERGLVGPTGATFKDVTVRDVLLRAMNAGISVHNGEEVGRTASPAIVDEETFRSVRAILTDPARRRTVGRPPKSLLAPVLRCGVCNGPANAGTRSTSPEGPRRPVYLCRVGHVSTGRADLDRLVGDLLVAYLEQARGAVAPPVRASKGGAAIEEIEKLRGRLVRLSDLFAAGELDAEDFAAGTRKARERLAALEERASMRPASTVAAATLVRAPDVRAAFASLDDDGRRDVLRELVEVITLAPATLPGSAFEPDRVSITWKGAAAN